MYHISNDKRTKRSAERVWKALLLCMKEKSFQDITVMDITKKCGMARTTFYRCFDNTSDILEWKCDESFYEVLDSYHPETFGGELDLARHYFSYWTDHYEILELLIKIGRQDIIYRCHIKNAEILHKRYGELQGFSKAHKTYYMAVRTGFTISILTAWLLGGRKESTGELLDIMEEQVDMLRKSWRQRH